MLSHRSPAGRPPFDHVVGSGQRHIEQHRHAALGEGEMVGAVEQPALGMVLVGDVAALRFRGRWRAKLPCRRSARARPAPRPSPARSTASVSKVRFATIVSIGNSGMLGIIFGAEQATLLARPCREQKRALRPRSAREQPRILEHRREPERIVGGTRPDRPPLRVGWPDPVGVPVPAVADRLVGILWNPSACRAHCDW